MSGKTQRSFSVEFFWIKLNCFIYLFFLYLESLWYISGTDVSELLSSKCHTLIVTGSQDYGVFVSDMTKPNSTELDYYNLQINSVR